MQLSDRSENTQDTYAPICEVRSGKENLISNQIRAALELETKIC